MDYIYICPSCGLIYRKEEKTEHQCPTCNVSLVYSDYTKDEWYQLPGTKRAEIIKTVKTYKTFDRRAEDNAVQRKVAQDNRIVVTTGDISRDYEILGPVYFQVSNKGVFSSTLSKLKKEYHDELAQKRRDGTLSPYKADWGFLYGEWSVGQNDFEAAFYVATEEIKKRARIVGGDAVIGMRQDIDLDTNSFAYFYLQMYGTAVKFI